MTHRFAGRRAGPRRPHARVRSASLLLLLGVLLPVLAAAAGAQEPDTRPLVVVTRTGRILISEGFDSVGEILIGVRGTDWGAGFISQEQAATSRAVTENGKRIIECGLAVPGSGGSRLECRQEVEVVNDYDMRVRYRWSFPAPVSLGEAFVSFHYRIAALAGKNIIAAAAPDQTITVPEKPGEPILLVREGDGLTAAPGDDAGFQVKVDAAVGLWVQDNRSWGGDVAELRFKLIDNGDRKTVPAGTTLDRTFTIHYNRPMRFVLDDMAPARVDRSSWFAYSVPAGTVPIDLSFLNEKPAGRRGFVAAARGRLAFADGTPVRFWGTTLMAGTGLPTHEEADRLSRHLAALGLNIARIRTAAVGGPNILLETSTGTSVAFRKEELDRFDYLVAALKREGAYTCIEQPLDPPSGPNGPPPLRPGGMNLDPVAPHQPAVVTRSKEIARRLWAHVNPYTRLAYKDEPAVALAELFRAGDLITDSVPNGASREWLEGRFRQWAAANSVKLDDKPIDFGSPTPPIVRFLVGMEAALYKDLSAAVHAAGVRVPVTTGNWCFAAPMLAALSSADYCEAHSPFDHPTSRLEQLATKPLVMYPAGLYTYQGLGRLVGKPFVASAWGAEWPSPWRAEGAIAMSAVAALQGYDGLLLGAFPVRQPASAPVLSAASGHQDPVTLGGALTAALVFRRGDVNQAVETVTVLLPEQEMLEKPTRGPWEFAPLLRMPEIHRVQMAIGEPPAAPGTLLRTDEDPTADVKGPLVSDTRELSRGTSPPLGKINSPRTQAVYGMLAQAGPIRLEDVEMRTSTPYGAVSVCSLTKAPIASSDRLMLSAIARAENTGAQHSVLETTLLTPGEAPILAEPVVGSMRVRCIAGLQVRPVGPDGKRGAPLPSTYASGWLSFQLGAQGKSVLYEVAR